MRGMIEEECGQVRGVWVIMCALCWGLLGEIIDG